MPHDPYELTEEQIRSWSKDEVLQFYSRKLKELLRLNDELGEDIARLKQEAEKDRQEAEKDRQEAEKDRELLKSLKAENDQLGVKYDELIAKLKGYLAQEQKQKPR